jgi:hypothetical protein
LTPAEMTTFCHSPAGTRPAIQQLDAPTLATVVTPRAPPVPIAIQSPQDARSPISDAYQTTGGRHLAPVVEVSNELAATHPNVKATILTGSKAKSLLALSKDGCVFKVAQITSAEFKEVTRDGPIKHIAIFHPDFDVSSV